MNWVLLGKLSLYIVSLFLDADTVLCGASNCALANLCSHTRYVSSCPIFGITYLLGV